MRRKNIGVEDLKNDIANALFQLLEKEEYSKITVEKLVKEADVSRSTYFRHFESKEDVIQFKLQSLWQEYVDKHQIYVNTLSIYDWVKCFFGFNLEIKDYVQQIYQIHKEACILNTLKEVISPIVEKEQRFTPFEMEFFCNGVVGLLEYWIKQDCKQTPEELIQFLQGDFF